MVRARVILATALAAAAAFGAGPATAGTRPAAQPVPDTSGQTGSTLYQVSCWSAIACVAAGDHYNSTGLAVTLAERWNGRHWSLQQTPYPSGSMGSHLLGVSCWPAGGCVGVGWYFDHSGVQVTLAEGWNGHRWAIRQTPDPAGAQASVLQGVSCRSATACVAVGTYSDGTGLGVTLAERWNGHRWAIQPTPSPSGSTGTVLTAVSCPAAACVAVGYSDISNIDVTLAERWNGHHWALQHTPDPAGAQANTLLGVSCESATACMAAGNYSSSSLAELTLAERWNGHQWAIQPTPNPAAARGSGLQGLSCRSTGCTATGGYTNSSLAEVTLAERWNGHHWALQRTPNPPAAAPTSCTRHHAQRLNASLSAVTPTARRPA